MNRPAHADAGTHPVILEETPVDGGVRLVVIGQADREVSVSYRLDAEGGSAGNTNRASQSGTAVLVPHRRSTLINLHLGTAGPWTAKLSVAVGGGEAYEINRRGVAH